MKNFMYLIIGKFQLFWQALLKKRSKRDGKYLEKLGTYNPNVNPPIVSLDVDATSSFNTLLSRISWWINEIIKKL